MSVLFADFLPVQEKYPKKRKLGLDFSRALVYNVKAVSDGGKDGRLAQLEEHLLDVQGVRGSSPLPPTTAWPRRSRRGSPYPAPSKEGALPLHKISATAWSPRRLKCFTLARRGRRGPSCSPPSKEGALPLFEILAAAWSLKHPNGAAEKAPKCSGLPQNSRGKFWEDQLL